MKLIHPGTKTANGYYLRGVLQSSVPCTVTEYWVKRVRHSDLTDTDTSQALTWDDFPTDVWLVEPYAHVVIVEAFEGGTTTDVDLIVGDTNDDNGLLTITALDGVSPADPPAPTRTTGAAEYGLRYEAAFVPLATFVATAGNLDTLTTGEVDIVIPFIRALTHRAAS